MSNAVFVIAEHIQGKFDDITFELLGKGKELAAQLGGELVAVLAHERRLPLEGRGRDGAPHDRRCRRRRARPLGQCAGRSRGAGRRLEAALRSLSASRSRVSSQAVRARQPRAP